MKKILYILAFFLLNSQVWATGTYLSGAGLDTRDAYRVDFKTTGSTLDMNITVSGAPKIIWMINGVRYTVADPGTIDFGSSATRYHSLWVSNNWAGVTGFYCNGNAGLILDLSELKHLQITGSLHCYSCPLLTGNIADFPSGLTGNLYCYNCPLLTGNIADFPSGLTGNLHCYSCPLLTYSAPSWPFPTGNTKILYMGSTNTFTQQEVDDIICHNAARSNTDCTLNLTGSSAAPSATGVTCKNTLIGRGWGVLTN